jgi:PAS domain S-box-containing protein
LIGEIIERKWTEEELSRSEYELTIMNQISEVFLTVSDDEMYPEVLKIVLEAMDSKYGLFGYINEDDGSIVYPSLTREVFGQCRISDKAIVFPRETWGGLWGQSLIEKKILYSNKPCKVPDEHIPITRSISTPIVYQDKLIGHIHVANKTTDYCETDRILIDKIAKSIAPVLYARLQKERQEKKRELAEGKLGESEQRYRAFMQNFQGIAFQGDMNFIPTFFHGTVEAITGYSEKEFTAGKPRWDQVIHPDDLPVITSEAAEKISSIPNYSDEREYRIIRKDGKICWVQEIIQNICDDSGKPSAVQGVIYDITERKLIEEELKNHRQHLEDLVEERTTELSKANKELEREIIERKQAEEKLYRKHQVQVALKDILNISIKPCGLEKMLDLILGRIVSIDWLTLESKSCIFLSDGDSNELVLKAYRDFSDILINSCSRIPFNKCVCGKAAATKEIQFISSDDSDHEIQPDDISPHSHYCVPILSFDKVLGVLNFYVKKDHQRNQEEDVFFRSVANVLAGIIKRKQAEENLKDRQQEIEEINATLENRVQEELEKSRQKDYIMIQKSRLAAMGEMMQYIIHQWGQPLNALNILFYNLELLLEDSDLGIEGREVDKFIGNGLKLVSEMFSTVDDFRNFFKTRKEKVKFSVNKNIKDSLSLFGDSLAHSKIAVTLNETGELTILGFPNEFFQVILNILKNAKDAIIANGVNGEINISLLSEGDSAIVRIEDNGGGIPEDVTGKVFDSYFSTKTEEKGTGIGLYMSKVIIEEHMNGHITAKNINGGAELEIVLPISEHNKDLSKLKPLLKESSPTPEKTVS